MYLLTQLSISDAVQNLKKIYSTNRKFLNAENFSVTKIAQTQVQENVNERKSSIVGFFQQEQNRLLFSWDYFLAESAKWSLMIGRFLRWFFSR